MLRILIPNYTINHCVTESSTAILSHSEGERGNMTRGHYLKISDELECKLLNNCPPINISAIVYIAGKEQTKKSVYFEFDLNLIQLLKNKCMYRFSRSVLYCLLIAILTYIIVQCKELAVVLN